IDLNFGCPAPKITRKGGGSALPWKTDLFSAIVHTAVREAARGDVPLTIKMRKGIDDDHLTYLDAARTAVDAGVSAITLHGRTCAQLYSGTADWDAITALKGEVARLAATGTPGPATAATSAAEDALAWRGRTGGEGAAGGGDGRGAGRGG